jgi:hypothetical protein
MRLDSPPPLLLPNEGWGLMSKKGVILASRHSAGRMSRVVGLYQILLRRTLEHFFPDATLETIGDRSFIQVDANPAKRANFRVADDSDGVGLIIEWFRTRYLLFPGSPSPFLPTERRLIESVVRLLDRRFRALWDPEVAQREDLFHYPVEDFAVASFLDGPAAERVPPALEALRVAALSTYENRRVSTGIVLLGTDRDPAEPQRQNAPGAPRYEVRLSAIKSVHRICDGLRTVYLVDRHGDLAWPVDIARWADQVHGHEPIEVPCPRNYQSHAKATRSGGHVALVLTPSQEIRAFARGVMAFAFSDARWRLLDIPSKFAAWRDAVGSCRPADLGARLFQAALNLAEARKGALFLVLRDPIAALPLLVAPSDRITDEPVADDPEDPDNLSPRLAKRALHHLVRGQDLNGIDASVLEAIAGVDGAVVTDACGRLLAFGAILRVAPDTIPAARAVEGARTTAALAASYHGPVLKVSEDGLLTMFLMGRRVWEL